jgi:hypothetical protein
LLDPRRADLTKALRSEFEGLTQEGVTQRELEGTLDRLITDIRNGLTEKERQFILSFKRGKPVWKLFPVTGIERLPGIQWKLKNIEKMPKSKHEEQLKKLGNILEAL